jgi:hypothetical protein
MTMFYCILAKLSQLPATTHPAAMKTILEEWRTKSQLIEDVVHSKTSFEAAVSPLVHENLRLRCWGSRGACNNPQFEETARRTAEQFNDILSLDEFRMRGRAPVTYDLTKTISFWGELKRALILALGIFGSLFIIMSISIGTSCKDPRTAVFVIFCFCAVMAAFVILASCFCTFPDHIHSRREFAQRCLERAKFMDEMTSRANTGS